MNYSDYVKNEIDFDYFSKPIDKFVNSFTFVKLHFKIKAATYFYTCSRLCHKICVCYSMFLGSETFWKFLKRGNFPQLIRPSK